MSGEKSLILDMPRLNNNEFLDLIPHLKLEELYFTQVLTMSNKWIRFLNVNFKHLSIDCGVCNQKIKYSYDDLMNHFQLKSHQEAVNRVVQFYNPIYTYGKNARLLARGEKTTEKELKSALMEINTTLKQIKREVFLKAKRFAYNIKHLDNKVDIKNIDSILLSLVLNTEVKSTQHMFVDVCIPLQELCNVIYTFNANEWKEMLTTDRALPNSKYFCNMCSKYCAGIITVNAHMNGFSHKNIQISALAVQCKSRYEVNKNCCIRFGEEYEIVVQEEARQFYKDKLEELITESRNVEEVTGDVNTEMDSITTDVGKNVHRSGQLEPEIGLNALSKELISKAQSLAGNIPLCFKNENVNTFDSNYLMGLIGVEYVLKIIKFAKDLTPLFECCLCEYVANSLYMQHHLMSYEHRKKYLDIHYPDTVKGYEVAIGHLKYFKFTYVMGEIVAKVALAIEKHHGRSLPFTIYAKDYNRNRPEIITQVYSFMHACQQHGPSFSNVVSQKEILELKNSEIIDKKPIIASFTEIRFTTTPIDKVYLGQKNHDPSTRVSENFLTNRKRQKVDRSCSPARKSDKCVDNRFHIRSKTRSRSPIEKRFSQWRNQREFIKYELQDTWNIYRKEISIAANEIENAFKEYRKNPESHPQYEEEWNSFWKRRKQELISEGINHRSYNFQPEWVQYFKERIEQLFGEALYKSKINIRRRLNIPPNAEEDCKSTTGCSEKDASSSKAQPISIHDNFYMKGLELEGKMGCIKNENFVIDTKTKSAKLWEAQPPSSLSDNKSNVVHVLRLLIALEEYLGSLGSKIMDLLSKALLMEKTLGENSMEFEKNILNVFNCNLLETAMEKLKGVLYAGLLDDKKIVGFRRVIQSTIDLLNYAERMGWRKIPHMYPEKKDIPHDLQKIMHVMQPESADVVSRQKSLSDTLIDIISLQRKDHSESTQYKSNKDLSKQYLKLDCSFRKNSFHGDIFSSYSSEALGSDGYREQGLNFPNLNTTLRNPQTSNSNSLNRVFEGVNSNYRNSISMSGSGGNNLNNNVFNNNPNPNAIIHINPGAMVRPAGCNDNRSGFHLNTYIPNVGQSSNICRGPFGSSTGNNWRVWNSYQQKK